MAGSNIKLIEKKALELGLDAAEKTGVYIVDVSYENDTLCYYIDREGGVDIDTCEKFSREVEPALDCADIIDKAYSLDVSSPGLDRKLKKEREFLYYIGREVEVKLYAARDGVKEFDGVLEGYHDNAAIIKTDKEIMEIPQKEAVYIRLKYVF